MLLEERWGRWRMTIAWPVIGRQKTILVDERSGKRGIHLEQWWGSSRRSEGLELRPENRAIFEGGAASK